MLPKGHLVDVATGHGKFAVAARDLGWQVTAFDARTVRFPDESGIDFVQADVRDFVFPESATAVSILGLLYHLELPAVRDLLARTSHLPTILDTHVAIHADDVVDGVAGRQFWENQERPTASVGNAHSFWPTELELTKLLLEAGYASIWRHVPSHRPDRTFWLCLPSGAPRLDQWEAFVDASTLDEDDLFARVRKRTSRPTTSHADALALQAEEGPSADRMAELEARLASKERELAALRVSHERLAGHPAVKVLRRVRQLRR